jgi:CRP-like cAMP-binding protein
MAKKSGDAIRALPKSWMIGLIVLNLVFMVVVYYYTDSPFGWTKGDLSDGKSIDLFDALAITQFVLFGITIDQLIKRAAFNFNEASTERKIPKLIVEVLSLIIFGLCGFTAYVLLYDHQFTHIIAATSGLGIGLVFLFKDFFQDIMGSLELQMEGLVSKGDYIDIVKNGDKECYRVVEMDRRRITLKRMSDDYERLISNKKFLTLDYINLSKQDKDRGSRRNLSVELFSERCADRVVDIFTLALEKVTANKERYMPFYICGIMGVADGAVTYRLIYECKPELKVSSTHNEIMVTGLRFLKAASLNISFTGRSDAFEPKSLDSENRLMNLYDLGILKVLSHYEVSSISKNAKVLYAKAGTHLIKRNENADSMYLISEGSLEVSVLDKAGNSMVVATLWPGDCVGEMSLLTGAPRSADVHVKRNAILVEIKKEDISPVLESNKELIQQMSTLLAERQAHNEKSLSREDQNNKLEEATKSIAAKILDFFFK